MSKKSTKKKQPYLFEEILNVLKQTPNKSINYKQVAACLNIHDNDQKQLINALLNELKEKNLIIEPERGKFKIKSEENFVVGKADVTTSGAIFVISEDSEQDVYIPPRSTFNAMQGDIVKVAISLKSRGKRKEGEIIEIIKRGRTDFVGTIQMSKNFAFLVPDNQRSGTDIYVPLDKLKGAKDGQKAIVKILEWPKGMANPTGEVIDVLGNAGENQTEMHAILAEFGLPYEFPKEVEKIADFIPTVITEEEIAKRRDFRSTTTFTIDPHDAKDFDDALSIKKLSNGNWEIGVHIADVSHYVKENSIIDKEAVARATSVYLVDRVVPMLPEILSNNVCSLRPKEDKLCYAAVFEMNEEAHVVNEWFGRTIIHSNRRFTYEEVQTHLENKESKATDDFQQEIKLLDKLAKKLRADRFKKGSIGFDKIEIKFHLDENGNPTGVYFKDMKDSNQLIEDFMLLANRKVAEFVGKNSAGQKFKKKAGENELPFVYRIHDLPNEDKLNDLNQFVKQFGYKTNLKPGKTLADSLNKLMTDVKDKNEESIISLLAIRTMAKAVYSTKNIGHYGLGFEYYTHFTSPIRRYPDVMVHRLLDHYLQGGKPVNEEELEEKCKHSSGMEKLAADAERASIKYKQVQYLQDRIGEEFDGTISGVTEWGIFIELNDNHCEGMVRMKDLTDDSYFFDESNYSLVGRRYKRVLRLGDQVRVEVKRADLYKKQLDFILKEKKSGAEKTSSKKTEQQDVNRQKNEAPPKKSNDPFKR